MSEDIEQLMNLNDELAEKDKEIERLKTELQDTKEHLGEYLHEQEEENNRLNNIINELERKMLNDKLYIENISKKQPYPIEEFRIRNPYTTGSYDTCINYLEKLQELKGSDKE